MYIQIQLLLLVNVSPDLILWLRCFIQACIFAIIMQEGYLATVRLHGLSAMHAHYVGVYLPYIFPRINFICIKYRTHNPPGPSDTNFYIKNGNLCIRYGFLALQHLLFCVKKCVKLGSSLRV
jgi:hypothetical protein